MKKEDQIINTLQKHSKKLSKHDKLFYNINKKLIEHDERFDRQMKAILDNRKDIVWLKENTATKNDFEDVKISIDGLTNVVVKISEDNVFIIQWLKRLQKFTDKVVS